MSNKLYPSLENSEEMTRMLKLKLAFTYSIIAPTDLAAFEQRDGCKVFNSM